MLPAQRERLEACRAASARTPGSPFHQRVIGVEAERAARAAELVVDDVDDQRLVDDGELPGLVRTLELHRHAREGQDAVAALGRRLVIAPGQDSASTDIRTLLAM